jgi:UDP:flavonoid glycosyltransferase YjiC (YdhE family)
MARFLISTMPAAGHVHPAVPVASALVARGHDVTWHTGTDYKSTVERTGAVFAPLRHTPDFAQVPPEPDPGTKGVAEGVSALRNLLVRRMAGQLADYEEIVDSSGVDAVLVDLCALGGRALHERRGIPWATLGISPLTIMSPDTPPFGTGRPPPAGPFGRTWIRLCNRLGGMLMRPLTAAYARERSALGLAPLPRGTAIFDHMVSSALHLQAATPSIEYPRRPWPANVHLVGPLLPPAPATADLPPWWGELDSTRPVVHITQGTVATDPAILTRPAIEGLSTWDGLVVVTTPDPDALGPVPPNVRVARFVPHGLLLPHVRAMVSNGGYNGVKTALAHGVPLVIAPWGNDQPDVAGRVSWAGAAVNLRVRSPEPQAVATAVRAVLADVSYRGAAARIRAEFARYPGGERAADLMVELLSRG